MHDLSENQRCLVDAGLRGKLPEEIRLPPSVTIPFSSFEEALKQPDNRDLAEQLDDAIKNIPASKAEEKLSEVRKLAMKVKGSRCIAHMPLFCLSARTNCTSAKADRTHTHLNSKSEAVGLRMGSETPP